MSADAAGGSELLQLAAIFWTAFLIGLSGALVPGPVLSVTIREAGRRGIAGGAVLCYMGLSMMRSLKTIELDLKASAEEGGAAGSGVTAVLLGISATVSNPYWFGWWGSIGAGLIVASSALGIKGIAAFITGHVLSDLVWYSAVSYLVSLGLGRGHGRWYRVLFAVCGVFLIVVGVLFVRYGFRINR
jgi:threonine/homoserine/homoserine lactone efflux protein